MGANRLKLIAIPGSRAGVVAQRREESRTLARRSFWLLQRADQLILRSNRAIDRAALKLKHLDAFRKKMSKAS